MAGHNQFVLDILCDLDIFTDIKTDDLKDLSSLFEERIFKRGEIIFDEGSVGSTMMIIASGEVRISQKADQETEEALVVLKKGDIFGEMALLEDLPRSATTISHTDVIIFEIGRENFLAFIESHSYSGMKIVLKLARTLSARLREADVKLKAFVSLSKWI